MTYFLRTLTKKAVYLLRYALLILAILIAVALFSNPPMARVPTGASFDSTATELWSYSFLEDEWNSSKRESATN